MFSGTGIIVTLVNILSQRRSQRGVKVKFKDGGRPRLFDDETKSTLKDKIEGIEKMTLEDFNTLIIRMKNLRCTLLGETKISY